MSIEIVYDRKFIRCGDRYIPFCLYGSSNCTQRNYRTGREVLERSWNTFVYNDDMLLATEAELMAIVRKYHDGDRSDNFRFRGEMLNDEQVVRFFQNGIKGAVTVEELREQTRCSVSCYLGAYVNDADAAKYPEEERWRHSHFETKFDLHPRTTDELVDWIVRMKAEKAKWIQSGATKHAYITINYYSDEAIKAFPKKVINAPCIAKCSYGYVVSASETTMSYNKDASKAKVFENSDAAYLYIRQNHNAGAVRLFPYDSTAAVKEKTIVLSLKDEKNYSTYGRLYVWKLTRGRMHYTMNPRAAHRFVSEKEALRYFEKKIQGRFSGVSEPRAEAV